MADHFMYLLETAYAVVCHIESMQLDINIKEVVHNLNLVVGQVEVSEGSQLIQTRDAADLVVS